MKNIIEITGMKFTAAGNDIYVSTVNSDAVIALLDTDGIVLMYEQIR